MTLHRLLIILMLVLSASLASTGATAQTVVGPKQYYLSLGDSLAFGTQPNYDWSHGYTDQWFQDLKSYGTQTVVNYSCMGETSTTFINGKCPWRLFKRTPYSGSQLSAAVDFIRAHPGQVSPVSIDIGVNDILGLIGKNSCLAFPKIIADRIATVDANLTQIILPALVQAMTDQYGRRTGDLVLVDYYDPYENACHANDYYFRELNRHLTADAAQFGIPVADIHPAFNPGTIPNEYLCSYTWMCNEESDVHPTGGQPGEPGNGYGVIEQVLEQTLGY